MHELTSPYNPASNGLAESAVKNAKHLMLKADSEKEDFHLQLYHFRNLPRADGASPAQLMFGRRQLSSLPTIPLQHKQIDLQLCLQNKDKHFQQMAASSDRAAVSPDTLSAGQAVMMRNNSTGHYDIPAKIISARPGSLSYNLLAENGKEYLSLIHI